MDLRALRSRWAGAYEARATVLAEPLTEAEPRQVRRSTHTGCPLGGGPTLKHLERSLGRLHALPVGGRRAGGA